TTSTVNKDVLKSWVKPSKKPLPAPQSHTQVINEEQDSTMEFSLSELGHAHSPIDNDGLESDTTSSSSGADVMVMDTKSSPCKLRKQKPVTYISSDSDDGLNDSPDVHNPEPEHAHTDTEQEDIKVSTMFQSMALVSERASSPLVAITNLPITFDPYTGYIPNVRF
ncbi:hypothetical protein PQX77_017457, partial [Marasmius sp. AFHP31]